MDCEKIYIGQTKQFLEKRLKQHLVNTKQGKIEESTLVEHQWEHNHKMDFNKRRILNFERDKFARVFKESAFMDYQNDKIISKKSYEIPHIWKTNIKYSISKLYNK